MKKEASIIIHQLRTAILPERKINEIWRDIDDEYSPEEIDSIIESLEIYRQEVLSNKEEYLGAMLDELILNIRLGKQPDRPKYVPKRF